jgi:hypothetical protein
MPPLAAWIERQAAVSADRMARAISATSLVFHRPGFGQTVRDGSSYSLATSGDNSCLAAQVKHLRNRLHCTSLLPSCCGASESISRHLDRNRVVVYALAYATS